jgi:hypothetical protein
METVNGKMTPLSLFPSLPIKFSTIERSISDSLGFSFGRFISKTKSHLRGVFGFKNYFKFSKLIFKNANCSRGFGVTILLPPNYFLKMAGC